MQRWPRDAAIAWCRWAIATTARILRQREKLDQAANELAGGRVFYRNEFPETGSLTARLKEAGVLALELDDGLG